MLTTTYIIIILDRDSFNLISYDKYNKFYRI